MSSTFFVPVVVLVLSLPSVDTAAAPAAAAPAAAAPAAAAGPVAAPVSPPTTAPAATAPVATAPAVTAPAPVPAPASPTLASAPAPATPVPGPSTPAPEVAQPAPADQEQKPLQPQPYLLGGSDTAWGGFGGLHIKASSLGGRGGLFVGGGGGLHFRAGRLGVNFGAAAYGLTLSSTQLDDGSGRRQNVDLGYGGITLGLGYVAPRIFELGVRSLIGVGGLCMFGASADAAADEASRQCTLSGTVLVVEPEAVIYIRFTQHFRMAFAGGYRFTIPPWENPDARALSGVGGTLGFEWGAF